MSNDEITTGTGPRGRLVILGTGITAIAHMTLETVGYIRDADVIFYHANSGVTAAYLQDLNNNVVDLYAYYGEGKLRDITYVQMAELMLREVRKGRSVAGVFHGHPGYFVKAGRRALAIAQMEGHETRLLPGISATDCLFADLRIDPGYVGVEIVKASHVLRQNHVLNTDHHLVLVQVGSVGDNTFSFTGFKHTKLDRLFERLIADYGEDHESVYYVASIFPGLDPVIRIRSLRDYREQNIQDSVHAATLYVPPAGVRVSELGPLQAFGDGEPYGQFEVHALRELETHTTPEGFKRRGASAEMLRTMRELAMDPETLRRYRADSAAFVAHNGRLTERERRALTSRDTGQMRSVTTDVSPVKADGVSREETQVLAAAGNNAKGR